MPRARDEYDPVHDWPDCLSDEEFAAQVQVILDEPSADLIGGWAAALRLAHDTFAQKEDNDAPQS